MCVHILLTIVNFLGGSAKCQGGKCIYVHSHKGLLMYACGTIFFSMPSYSINKTYCFMRKYK